MTLTLSWFPHTSLSSSLCFSLSLSHHMHAQTHHTHMHTTCTYAHRDITHTTHTDTWTHAQAHTHTHHACTHPTCTHTHHMHEHIHTHHKHTHTTRMHTPHMHIHTPHAWTHTHTPQAHTHTHHMHAHTCVHTSVYLLLLSALDCGCEVIDALAFPTVSDRRWAEIGSWNSSFIPQISFCWGILSQQ